MEHVDRLRFRDLVVCRVSPSGREIFSGIGLAGEVYFPEMNMVLYWRDTGELYMLSASDAFIYLGDWFLHLMEDYLLYVHEDNFDVYEDHVACAYYQAGLHGTVLGQRFGLEWGLLEVVETPLAAPAA